MLGAIIEGLTPTLGTYGYVWVYIAMYRYIWLYMAIFIGKYGSI